MNLEVNNKIYGSLIFKCVVGSHAYGTNIEESDWDIKGVYIQSPESVLEDGYLEQVSVSNDETYFELRRFVDLCCTGNPTMLELLFSDKECIIFKEDIFDLLIDDRNSFLTKLCKYSFGGYAISQIGKAKGLQKKMNWEGDKIERKEVLDFCYIIPTRENISLPVREWLKRNKYSQEHCGLTKIKNFENCYFLYYDHLAQMKSENPKFLTNGYGYKGITSIDSNEVLVSQVPDFVQLAGTLFFNKNAYSTHCKDYKSYQEWLETRNTQRFVDVEEHGQKIDGKNMLHCMRLLAMGKEIAEGKGVIVKRPDAEYLISVRKGKVDLNTLIEKAEKLKIEIDNAFDEASLPAKIDKEYFFKLVKQIRKWYYENKSNK